MLKALETLDASPKTRRRVTVDPGEVGEAVSRAVDWLLARQADDGHWCGELQGDTILESEYLLLLTLLKRERSELAGRVARYLVEQQLPEGGWAQYPGGKMEISGSVKAYFALKLTGHDAHGDTMTRARRAIRAAGGADWVNSYTRFFLAMLGQIPYECCPAVPPEIVLLPDWFGVNLYNLSAWSRAIVVPLSIVWANQPVRRVPPWLGVRELFLRPPDQWPPLRGAGVERPETSSERFFRRLDAALRWCRRHGLTPLRRRALRAARAWMLERFAGSDGLGAIFPPIVWSVVALKSLGYADDAPEVRACLDELDRLMLEDPSTGSIRLQPCKSPVWDTALSLRALAAAGVGPRQPAIRRGIGWLADRQIRRPGDWSRRVEAEPGGWCFEFRNDFYPDVDDTAMVLMALQEGAGPPETIARGRRWMLAMQNRDGGWGAFDRDNDTQWLCSVPFADHNAMIDPSTPDLSGRVLECLGRLGRRPGDAAVDRAVAYLRRTQQGDGSWYGRWGVNYVYGTWQALSGLDAVGVPHDDLAVLGGRHWLAEHQQPCGGWGESPASYDQQSLRGCGPATASQTAWAVLGLTAAGMARAPATCRGVRFLLDQQNPAGIWDEPYFTGTGFPRVFYLRYHAYAVYFPILALAGWLHVTAGRAAECESRRPVLRTMP